jgi:membrane-associated protease RseP (regulator of RpoE activity)
MFFVCEGIFRRPLGKRVVQAANMAGLAVLLSIFLFATYGDIQRLRTPAAPESSSPSSRP